MKFTKQIFKYAILLSVLFSCTDKKHEVYTKYIELKNQRIEYKVRNPDSKKSCLLIHGFGDSYSSFENLFTFFDSLRIKTIYYDLPGMGTNKEISLDVEDNLSLIKKIYDFEATDQTYAIGHSIGGLLSLLSAVDNKLVFKRIITIEPSITKPDFNFFEYIQEKPVGIGLDSFINKNRPQVGYTSTYTNNLLNSNINQLRIYANSIYENFGMYTDKIFQSDIKFVYVFGNLSSGQEYRRSMGSYINVDTICFNNARHWVHYDAFSDFKTYLNDEFKK
jgi:pimeloyl-ACP methyl ester carboxylesterase